MRPELPADHADRWLNDCLNESRREHLTPEQVMWLLREGRKVGVHNAIAWITEDCGYSAPTPVDPEDERAKLQREYIEAAKSMARLADKIERASSSPGPRLAACQGPAPHRCGC